MGNAAFYFSPQPDGRRLIKIDLGERLGELFSDFEIDAQDAVARDSSQFRSTGLNREIVTIQRDRFAAGEALASKLVALQNHLDRGYSCAFTADDSYNWAFPVTRRPISGDQNLGLGANPFVDFTNKLPVASQYCVLESESPTGIREQVVINSASVTNTSGGTVTLNDPYVNFTYPRRAFLRWYRFFPVLRRPQADVGKNIVTNEGGRLFSLNIRLVVDLAGLFLFHNCSDGVIRDPDPLPPQDITLIIPPELGGSGNPPSGGGGSGPKNDWKPDGKWADIDRPTTIETDADQESAAENNGNFWW